MNNHVEQEVLHLLEHDKRELVLKLLRSANLECFSIKEDAIIYQKDNLETYFHNDGTKEWWVNDQLHRENDKPAIIWSDGTKEWLINGQHHRDNDKPAIIWNDGTKEWWANGKLIKKENK